MNFDTYRAIGAWNWSLIKMLSASPAHLRHAIDHPDDGDTANRRALRAYHCAVLEPELMDRLYPVCDVRRDRRTGAYQAWLAAHPDAQGERDTADDIAAAVRAHPIAGPLLCGPDGSSEMTVTWTDQATGLACKGRLDRLVEADDGSIIVADLKTWRSTEPRLVTRGILDAGWHGQLAHYGAGVEALYPGRPIHYRLVIVEATAPHDVGVYDLDGAPIEAGLRLRRGYLDTLARCLRENRWPGRCPELVPIELPEWALPEMEDINTDTDSEDIPA